MVKIFLSSVVALVLIGKAVFGGPSFSCFIPDGWKAGNGFDNDPYPYFQEINIDRDHQKEILLHCSYKEKDEYLPNRHVIYLLAVEKGKYRKKWSKHFDSVEGVFFLARDINKDGKEELVVHELHSGNGAYGKLWVFQIERSGLKELLCKDVEGETYLWDPLRQISDLNSGYFPDADRDGRKEIITGHRVHLAGVSSVDEPWRFDVYKWNGKGYVLAFRQ